jgi:SAM-dependent methyltransferase
MQQPPPDALMKLIDGHMTFKYVAVASQVGLFAAMADGARPLPELAERIGLPARTLRILADALLSTGWLERDGDGYRNSPVTAAYLSGGPGVDLRTVLEVWDRVIYLQWTRLEESLRTGQATMGFDHLSPDLRQMFSVGIEHFTAPSARALPDRYDFSRRRSLLDLGGGTGSFILAALERHPGLRATLFESPATAAIARQRLKAAGGLSNIEIVEGDLLKDALPEGHDTVLVANVIHLFSPESTRDLLRRVRAAVSSGAQLLLVDFWTDPTHTQPSLASLMAGEFLIVSGEGDVYSAEEVFGWLRECGFRPVDHIPLAGAASLITAEA